MWVVKLGGSLYKKAELTHWLEQLTILSQKHPITIVPGGGPFADQIRQAQQHYSFSDEHAHHMALLAMAQFGLAILSLSKNCEPLYYPTSSYVEQHQLSVWLPDKSLLSISEIPQNWKVTSDSLALWLAHQLNADRLTLVKQAIPTDYLTINELSDAGIIDKAFPEMFSQYPVPSTLALASDHEKIQSIFNNSVLVP